MLDRCSDPSAAAPRIAVFTHDTFGLGHVRRCLRILGAISERAPESALMLITGSPALPMLSMLPPNADLVKLPTIVRTGTAGSQPPHLPIPLREITAIRRKLIRGAVETFRPDVLLADNFPVGARRELLPALEILQRAGGRAVVGLRDIVDTPEKVRTEWARDEIYEVLAAFYQRILVYGPDGVTDVPKAYGLDAMVAKKVEYCGYVGPAAAQPADPESVQTELGLSGPFIMATVGGGGDGLPLITAFLKAMKAHPSHAGLVVTGPLMGAAERDRLERLAKANPRIVMRSYLENLPRYMAAADAVVAMGGYNTTAELIVQGCRAVIVPRTWRFGEHARRHETTPEGEQLLRAEGLARRGLAEFLHPDDLAPAALAGKISDALTRPRPSGGAGMDGASRVAGQILGLAVRPVEVAL